VPRTSVSCVTRVTAMPSRFRVVGRALRTGAVRVVPRFIDRVAATGRGRAGDGRTLDFLAEDCF